MNDPTPRPWAQDPELNNEAILGSDNVLIANCSILHRNRLSAVNEANAALIVRAVNAHDALVAAAEDFIAKVESGRAQSRDSYAKFKSALALMKGEQP